MKKACLHVLILVHVCLSLVKIVIKIWSHDCSVSLIITYLLHYMYQAICVVYHDTL